MKKLVLLLAGVAAIGLGFTVIAAEVASPAKQAESAAEAPATQNALFEPLALTLGDANAPVVIEEYASLSCSHCAHFEKEVLPGIKKELIDTGKARFVMVSYLRNGPDLKGSMLLSCLKDNDRRWNFAKVLFSMQDKWAFDENFEENLGKIAQVGGVSKDEFDTCMKDDALEAQLLKQREAIDKLREIKGTPSFFVNGKPLEGAPNKVESFVKAVAQ